MAAVSAQHERLPAVSDKAGTKKIITRAIRADAFDFHSAVQVANHRYINKPTEVCWPKVIAQPDINCLAASEAFACNYVRGERDNAAVESASDGWHVIN
ncbi:MAG: hypothetical protein U5L02_06355 [Rheinheimera sp.]|nr:hypothetical protein [Rheinheimera sp.]